jgi:hypothetical protein
MSIEKSGDGGEKLVALDEVIEALKNEREIVTGSMSEYNTSDYSDRLDAKEDAINDCIARVEHMKAALASNKASAGAVAEPVYVPIATSSWEEIEGRHPNDKTPQDADCQKVLNRMGDDSGQGLSSYWKWGFRSGWRAALDHRLLQDHIASEVATHPAPIASAEEKAKPAMWFVSTDPDADGFVVYTEREAKACEQDGDDVTPLYTHPAAAHPSRAEVLTAGQILSLRKAAELLCGMGYHADAESIISVIRSDP